MNDPRQRWSRENVWSIGRGPSDLKKRSTGEGGEEDEDLQEVGGGGGGALLLRGTERLQISP